MSGSPRQIIESKEYSEQIAALGGAKSLDAALDVLCGTHHRVRFGLTIAS